MNLVQLVFRMFSTASMPSRAKLIAWMRDSVVEASFMPHWSTWKVPVMPIVTMTNTIMASTIVLHWRLFWMGRMDARGRGAAG